MKRAMSGRAIQCSHSLMEDEKWGIQVKRTVEIFMPLPCTGVGVGYTCTSIAKGLGKNGLDVTLVTPKYTLAPPETYKVVETIPRPLQLIPFKLVKGFSNFRLERAFLARFKRNPARVGTIAYLWPGASINLVKALRAEGAIIVREMINSHLMTAKQILDNEYKRCKLLQPNEISAMAVQQEREFLSLSDFVFCSNRESEKSVVESGVPDAKVLSTSFGWDPERFASESKELSPVKGVTLLFVGLICIRKGAHLILEYWARSNIPGRLVMVGAIEPELAKKYAHLLSREDVILLKYTKNISGIYKSADIFVFPTLEEGGPQVTCEAAGCRLPVITTPMGAARVIQHGVDGFIIDPFDATRWMEAIKALSSNLSLRQTMADKAGELARQFTWDKIGDARARQLREIAN